MTAVLQYMKSGIQIGISQSLPWNTHTSFHDSTKLLSYPGAALNLKQGSVCVALIVTLFI